MIRCMFCRNTGIHMCPGGVYRPRDVFGMSGEGYIFPGLVDADAFPYNEENLNAPPATESRDGED